MVVKKRRGLGKGLDALLGKKDEVVITISDAKGDAAGELEIEKIQPGEYQPRTKMDKNSLEELAQSIREQGLISPILVRPIGKNRYEIIAGERRWRAAKMAGLTQVPAFIRNYTPKQIKEISIIENLQREDLNPIEAAKAIKQLMEEYDLTQEAVADRIGKSRPAIANTLRLLSLPVDVVELIEKNKLSAGHARCLIVLPNPLDQTKVALTAVEKKLSVRELEKLVKNILNPAKERPKSEQSLELKGMIDDMQKIFATKVSAIGNDNKGRIYIDYYSKDDLDRIAELIQLINKKTLTLRDLSLINKK